MSALEWSGAILGVLGALLMSGAADCLRRQFQAYVLWFASSVVLTTFGLATDQYGIAFNQAVFLLLNARGLINRWPDSGRNLSVS